MVNFDWDSQSSSAEGPEEVEGLSPSMAYSRISIVPKETLLLALESPTVCALLSVVQSPRLVLCVEYKLVLELFMVKDEVRVKNVLPKIELRKFELVLFS